MSIRWLEVAAFVILLVVLFVWAGEVVTRASGSTRPVRLSDGVSMESGESVFWGEGKCHTCHAIGGRGGSVRGPNLGESADGPPMAVRAVDRAREHVGNTGNRITPTQYLVESLSDPSAYVVVGFKDEMPVVYEPPISLNADQFASVVLYLQSLGGEPDPLEISVPPAVHAARSLRQETSAWEPLLDGDPERGREMFFDTEGPVACSTCHRVGEEGGDIGPELTHIAGTRALPFIVESLLNPDANIAGGYETVLIETMAGRILDGVVHRETSDSLWLGTSTGEELGLSRSDIARSRAQETSLMPGDLAQLLSVRDLRDLLAYLRTLQ